MYTSDIICVTNRIICSNNGESFLERIGKVVKSRPHAIILREKDLSLSEYRELARAVSEICRKTDGSRLIIHNFYELVLEEDSEVKYTFLHMPLWKLEDLYENSHDVYKRLREKLTVLGASCHSVEDAKLAEKLGCTYIIAGHIYNTDCKKGLEGRGLGFLTEVADSVKIPVYAIGGITPENIGEVRNAGASGACIMSSSMTCNSPKELLESFRKE
ncbi:MAG: thiamine phosphate synthase [Eubacterium sp.]|nr:thiamine phosphate synthase [Eubacterium sp.]